MKEHRGDHQFIGGLAIPTMTTLERQALTPTVPMIAYESDYEELVSWDVANAEWVRLGENRAIGLPATTVSEITDIFDLVRLRTAIPLTFAVAGATINGLDPTTIIRDADTGATSQIGTTSYTLTDDLEYVAIKKHSATRAQFTAREKSQILGYGESGAITISGTSDQAAISFGQTFATVPSIVMATMTTNNATGQARIIMSVEQGSITDSQFIAHMPDGSGGSGGMTIQWVAYK